MVCTGCGMQSEDSDPICGGCGKDVHLASPPAIFRLAQAMQQQAAATRAKAPRAVGMLLALLGIEAACVIFAICFGAT